VDRQARGARQTAWTPEDLGRFVGQVRNDRFFALWMLVATTGLPLETILGLRRGDLNVQSRRIVPSSDKRASTRHARSFGLDPNTYDSLRDHVITWDKERYAMSQDTRMLFVWSNGQPLDAASASRMFRQHCAGAGIPVVSIEQMRTAYATAALEFGIPTKVITDRLGRDVGPSVPVIPIEQERTHRGNRARPTPSGPGREPPPGPLQQNQHATTGRGL